MVSDILTDVSLEFTSQKLIDFRDKHGHLRNELDETFGYKNDTIVFAELSTSCNDVSDLIGDLCKSHVLGLNFFTNKNKVDLSSQGALQGNMRSRSTHESDEVIVLF